MLRKKHTPQQIIGKLREAKVALAGCWVSPSRARRRALDREIFYSLKEAQVLIEIWLQHDNTIRPHSAPGYKPPALEVIAPRRADPALANQGLQPVQPFPQTAFGVT